MSHLPARAEGATRAYNGFMNCADEEPQSNAEIVQRTGQRVIYCAVGLALGFLFTGLWKGWETVLHVWWAVLIVLAIPLVQAFREWRRLNQRQDL